MTTTTLAEWLDEIFDRIERVRDMDVPNDLRSALFIELQRRNFLDEQRGLAESYLLGGNWRYKAKPYRLEVSDFYPTAADVQHLQTQFIPITYFQERIKQLRVEIRTEEEKRARVAFSDAALEKRVADATRLMIEKNRLLMKAENEVDNLRQEVKTLQREREPLQRIVAAMIEDEARFLNQLARSDRAYIMEWALHPQGMSEDEASELLSQVSARLSQPIETALERNYDERGILTIEGLDILWILRREGLNRLDIAKEITTLDGVRRIQWHLRNDVPLILCHRMKTAEESQKNGELVGGSPILSATSVA